MSGDNLTTVDCLRQRQSYLRLQRVKQEQPRPSTQLPLRRLGSAVMTEQSDWVVVMTAADWLWWRAPTPTSA